MNASLFSKCEINKKDHSIQKRYFIKKDVFKNLAKFTGLHLRRGLFFQKSYKSQKFVYKTLLLAASVNAGTHLSKCYAIYFIMLIS